MKKLATALLLTTLSAPALAADKPMPGDAAPIFSATSLSGKTVALDQYRGQPVSLVFLDSLCPMPHWPDCESELSKVQKLSAKDKKNQWVGIVKGFYIDESWVKSFAERWQLKFPMVWDQNNEIFSQYKVFGNPYQIWVNKEGKVVSRNDTIQSSAR